MKNASKTIKQVMAMFLAVCLILSPFSAVPAKAGDQSLTIMLNAGDVGKIYDGSNVMIGNGIICTENVLVDDIDTFYSKITEEYSVKTTDPEHIVFYGWHLEGRTDAATAEDIRNYAGSHTSFQLYALYKTVYTVTMNANGGIFANNKSIKKVQVEKGTKFSAVKENVSKTGYKFNGWFTDDKTFKEAVTNDEQIEKDMAVYASYEPNKYKVSFKADGKLLNETKEVLFGSAYGNIFPTSDKKGYDFENWYDEENNMITASSTVRLAKNHELHAKFVPHIYTIKYELGGGILKTKWEKYAVESVSDNSVSANDIVIGTPELKNFDFAGWTITQDNAVLEGKYKEYTIKKGTTSDFVFKANYVPHKFQIKYDLDGGTLKDKVTDYTAEMTEYIKVGTPEKKGYDFKGWTVTKDKTVLHNTYDEYTIEIGTTSDFVFKANFVPHKYTITYNLDGGTLTNMVKDYTVEMKEYILVGTPEKTGYDFTGWTVTKDGEALRNNYMTYLIDIGMTSDFKFHANWKKKEDKIKKVSVVTVKKMGYTVTKTKKKNGKTIPTEVAFTKCDNDSIKSFTVPATVKIEGVSVKVTKIDAKAFIGCEELTKITIGKNVKKIGAKAFYGCEKLKRITVKSKSLKSIGSKAFKGIDPKAVVRVVKAKKVSQTNLFSKAVIGHVKTWTIQ